MLANFMAEQQNLMMRNKKRFLIVCVCVFCFHVDPLSGGRCSHGGCPGFFVFQAETNGDDA